VLRQSLDASKEKKKNIVANGVAQYRAIDDKFKKTCQVGNAPTLVNDADSAQAH